MIPEPGSDGLLAPGIYTASLSELHERFVASAPYPKERERVFDAFDLWYGLLTDVVSVAAVWINGGFVTHKDWAAPQDIDIAVLIDRDILNALDREGQRRIWQLKTIDGELIRPGGRPNGKIQAMGGLVDSYIEADNSASRALWKEDWSSVYDESKRRVRGVRKGFVEVRL